uniref:Ig-like domain-containing protein n=1 Tax=Cyprinus carpio TaxID=7962 RepID=A0A8C2IZP7_CYPCA
TTEELYANSLLALCGVFCVELTQPPSMVVKPHESFSISCRISESSYCINWIRQPTGKALEWLGYLCNGGGTNIKNKISFTQDTSKNTVFLWGNNFQTEDTAVYYCTRETQSLNKEYFPITNRCNIPADPKRPTVRILRPSDGDLSGLQNTNLLCLITGFFPSDISVSAHRVTKPAKGPDGKFSIRSHLDLQPSDWAPGEVYTCRVTHLADTLVLNISMKTGTLDFKY